MSQSLANRVGASGLLITEKPVQINIGGDIYIYLGNFCIYQYLYDGFIFYFVINLSFFISFINIYNLGRYLHMSISYRNNASLQLTNVHRL